MAVVGGLDDAGDLLQTFVPAEVAGAALFLVVPQVGAGVGVGGGEEAVVRALELHGVGRGGVLVKGELYF